MRTLVTPLFAVLLLGGAAYAQGSQREEVKKKMEEISDLMRESEQLLIEAANSGQIFAEKNEVARKLEELLKQEKPPPEAAARAQAERQRQQEELEGKQQELDIKLTRLLDGQSQSGRALVGKLEDLLRKWPPSTEQSQRPERDSKSRQPKPRQDEQKQRQPRDPRNKLQRERDRQRQKAKDREKQLMQQRLADAWLARLPPEEQERLRRGDFSNIPQRYRRLVERYTMNAARSEAEEDTDGR